MSASDAVDGSFTGTQVAWMWVLLMLPRFEGAQSCEQSRLSVSISQSRCFSCTAKIDADKGLSRERKAQHRHAVAKQAIAEIEKSRALVKAREAVRHVMEQWQRNEQHVSPEIAEVRDATLKAMKEVEAGWQKAIDKIAERAAQTKAPDRRRNPPWGVYSRSSLPHRR